MSQKNTNIPTQDDLNRKKIKLAQSVSPTLSHVQISMLSLDLTSLTGSETEADITELCGKARKGSVAAVCVYPQYVAQAAKLLQGSEIEIATVINFPHGDMTNDGEVATPENTEKSVVNAIANGATEIDIVIDYKNYMREEHARSLLRACKKACGENAKMKVILETGTFEFEGDIECLSSIAIEEGADFIKTSTGKYSDPEFPEVGGATFEAVLTMLDVIKKYQNKRPVGLKISGGVNELNFVGFLEIARTEMSDAFLSLDTFRIGASGLYDYLDSSIRTKEPATDHVKKHGILSY